MPTTNDEFAAYDNFTVEDAKKDREAIDDNANANSRLLGKLAEGLTTLRVLPGRPGKPPFRIAFKHFFQVGGENVSFYCPRMEAKQKCRACTEAAQLMASSSDLDQKMGKKMRVSQKFLANVLVRGKEDVLGVKVWEGSSKQHEKLLDFRDRLGVNYTHPLQGQDVSVIRSGTGMETEYSISLDHNGKSPIARSKSVIRETLNAMHDLDSVVNILSAQEIDEKMDGTKRRPERPGTSRGGQQAGYTREPGWGSAPKKPAQAAAAPPADDLDSLDDDDALGGQAQADDDDIPF